MSENTVRPGHEMLPDEVIELLPKLEDVVGGKKVFIHLSEGERSKRTYCGEGENGIKWVPMSAYLESPYPDCQRRKAAQEPT